MYGANVIIFEGILTFYNADVLKVIICSPPAISLQALISSIWEVLRTSNSWNAKLYYLFEHKESTAPFKIKGCF